MNIRKLIASQVKNIQLKCIIETMSFDVFYDKKAFANIFSTNMIILILVVCNKINLILLCTKRYSKYAVEKVM